MSSGPPFYDVLILGGGVAGSTAALRLLRNSTLRVAIIERSDYGEPRVGETIAPGVDQHFKTLGVWESFVSQRHLPSYGTSSSWGSDQVSIRDFIYSPFGNGWHLDRNQFDAMLATETEKKGATVYKSTQVVRVSKIDDQWEVEWRDAYDNTGKIHAGFIIEARGRTAKLAREQGSKRIDYDQLVGVAGIISFSGTGPEDSNTLIETDKYGWWHASRLPQNKVVVTWFSDADLIKKSGMGNTQTWMASALNTKFICRRMHGGQMQNELKTYSAKSSILDELYGKGWVAAGDAGASHDPLSSSGIHRALEAGMGVAQAVQARFSGDSAQLAVYSNKIKTEFTEFLKVQAQYYAMEKRWPQSPFWQRRNNESQPV